MACGLSLNVPLSPALTIERLQVNTIRGPGRISVPLAERHATAASGIRRTDACRRTNLNLLSRVPIRMQ